MERNVQTKAGMEPKASSKDLPSQRMRASGLAVFAATLVAIFLPGCQTQQQRDAERERARQDVKSAAYKAGEAARRIATEAEKASADAARKLNEGARKAGEGWREQERKDREHTTP
jgi:hypothetical protein